MDTSRALAVVTTLAALTLSCASTPDTAPVSADTAPRYVAGLDGCTVRADDDTGRTVICGHHLGALVLAGKTDGQTLVDTFLDGMGEGAGAKVAREPADRDIAGTIAQGTHAWFTNKGGELVDGWLGIVTAGGQRRLVGCFLLGQSIADRCPALLAVLRDAPMLAGGRYPVSVLGIEGPAPEGCEVAPNRASCGSYEFQWYEDGAGLPVDKFVGRFLEQGSTVAQRGAVDCQAVGGAASCEHVKLESPTGNVDITFAYPATGGVLLCIVEAGRPLEPMCASFMSVGAAP
jgi:hypothetical protein